MIKIKLKSEEKIKTKALKNRTILSRNFTLKRKSPAIEVKTNQDYRERSEQKIHAAGADSPPQGPRERRH